MDRLKKRPTGWSISPRNTDDLPIHSSSQGVKGKDSNGKCSVRKGEEEMKG